MSTTHQLENNVNLLDFQAQAVERLAPKVLNGESCMLIGQAGTGKTYALGSLIDKIIKSGYLENRFSHLKPPFDIFYLTKSPVVEQTREVLFGEFKISPRRIFITSYDQMRSTLGGLFITWQKRYSRNLQMEIETPIWRSETRPKLIIADECQALKNERALQTEIMMEYPKIGGQVIAASATPFAKVLESKFFVLATKPTVPVYGRLDESNFVYWANEVAGGTAPWEYNSEAMERVKNILDPWIVRFDGVKFKKRTLTHCKLIDFETPEDLAYFMEAYEDYLKELAQVDRDEPGGLAKIWTITTKFRKRAEDIKAKYFPKIAKEIAEEQDKQIIIGSNYVSSLEICKQGLIDLGIPEDKIAVIVGGQNKQERQRNIKAFQTGKATYCLLTLRSGGVGLSLHHHPKNAKTCKPRYVIAPPTWSPIEIVQFLGRGHRINSISTTYQDIVWFKGTVEEEVADKVSRGLGSLSKLIAKREIWTDVFMRRKELGSVDELKNMVYDNAQEKDDDDSVEEFAVEALDNAVDSQEDTFKMQESQEE
jgi:superfamily II DNA or RNA helicase